MKAFFVVVAIALSGTAEAKQDRRTTGQRAAAKPAVETTVRQQWTPGAVKSMQTPFLADEGRENAFEVPLLRDAKEIRESQTAPRSAELRSRRQAPGGTPTSFLKARLNAASDS